MAPATRNNYISVEGVKIFYREAGAAEAPVVLLLHGFPSSSFQYRNLIPRLAEKYRVIAPDLPGFGFTEPPKDYIYTFDAIGKTITSFTNALNLVKFAIYVFDYGAPTGFRLALARPDAVTAIISQNGNTFEEGLGDFWNIIRPYWAEASQKNRDAIKFLVTFDVTKSQYVGGEANPDLIAPETYYLDQALLDRPGNSEIQLDLFLDYQNNVAAYPSWHKYLQERQPPVLAIWGKNDPIFIPPGAEAFKKVVKQAEVHLVDGGHFVLENHVDEVSEKILDFLGRKL